MSDVRGYAASNSKDSSRWILMFTHDGTFNEHTVDLANNPLRNSTLTEMIKRRLVSVVPFYFLVVSTII